MKWLLTSITLLLCAGMVAIWFGVLWSAAFSPEAPPARNHAAAPIARFKTLAFLELQKGRITIAGRQHDVSGNQAEDASAQLPSERKLRPVLYSADFSFTSTESRQRKWLTDRIKKEWQKGALIDVTWQPCSPANLQPCGEDAVPGAQSFISSFEWNQLLIDGSAVNQSWKAMLDEVASYLLELEEAGVEIMFRPLQAMNHRELWWGGRPGPLGTAQLYRLTRDYLQNVKGLRSLIWVWSVEDFPSLALDLQSYDPGSDYYDVLALEVCGSDGTYFSEAKYRAMRDKAAGKPIAISGSALAPSPEVLAAQAEWSYYIAKPEKLPLRHHREEMSQEFHAKREPARQEDMAR